MALLLFLRQRFIWRPLYPLGLSHRPELYYSLLRLADYFHGLVSQNHRLALRRYSPLPGMDAFLSRSDARRFFTASLWVETGKIAIQGNMTFNF
jgi:hypothetical protein